MTIQSKKLKNGFEISEYGLGTWQMGGRNEKDPANDDVADIRAIQYAIEKGVYHIDTAEVYAAGHTEELIATALQEKKIDRRKLFIVSKVAADNQGYGGVIVACTQSLKRLETDYLDLYLLHRYEPAFPLADTVRALNELKDQGLVKNIGVSNFGIEHLKEAQRYSKYPIVCNQVHYNLRVRETEKSGLLQYCQQNDIILVAYRPTEKAKLFEHVPAIIKEMCKKYNKSFAQISINWLVSQTNVTVLAKTRNPVHLEENLGALGWTMEAKDIERLRAEFPDQISVSDVVPLS